MKYVPFRSKATTYMSGSGAPFPPGAPLNIRADHAEDLRAAKLEAEPENTAPAKSEAES